MAGEYEAPLFGAYSKKIGMWLFLASDSLTFGALLLAFSYNRIYESGVADAIWKESITNATIMTACLLSSSLTMVMAVFAAQRGDQSWTRNWLLATMVFGTAFIVLHGMEWSKLIARRHRRPSGNPWAASVPQFGGTFFTLTANAHAARDDWRDLFGRGGATQSVSADSRRALDGEDIF